jgi:putative membrane protein
VSAVTLDPAVIAGLALAEGLFLRAVLVLGRRGYDVPTGQQVAWHLGMLGMAVSLLGPLDSLGDDLLTAHMGQHLLIADLSAPLILVGIRTPVLQFFLPRPVLVPVARATWLRRAFRFLRRPLVAVPLWILTLYSFHFAALFEGALRNDWLHALQHEAFIVSSMLVWWSALEPKRRRLRGELWKIGSILGARLGGMFLGMAFLAMRTPAYADWYGDSARDYGLSPLADQQLAGGLMLTVDAVVMLFALTFFFWRSAADADRAERAAAAAS